MSRNGQKWPSAGNGRPALRMAGRKEGADVIIEQIRDELGPRYATLIDAIGWSVWTAEWRIDLTDEARYYIGRDAAQRTLKRALQEGYIGWNELN